MFNTLQLSDELVAVTPCFQSRGCSNREGAIHSVNKQTQKDRRILLAMDGAVPSSST